MEARGRHCCSCAVPLRAFARRVLPFRARVLIRALPAMAAFPFQRAQRKAEGSERLRFAHVQCERATPLRRDKTAYDEALQRAKEQNVARAAALMDGAVIGPGETLSWHACIGPPLKLRGFAEGPELHDGSLAPGTGGGLCQVANLLYWLAVHANLDIVERHRHHLDLFPDDHRTAPFGCGATVYFPRRDLKLRNPHRFPALVELAVRGDALNGAIRFENDPGFIVELIERDHRFIRRDDGVHRENVLLRKLRFRDGTERTDWLCSNSALVSYDVEEHLVTRGNA